MSINALNKRIEWLCAAFAKSKLENERQQRGLADRHEQIQRLEAVLGDRDERIQRLEAALDDRDERIQRLEAALDDLIRSSPAEQAFSPPKLPVCTV